LGELTALTGIPRTTVYRLAGELVSRRVLDHSNGRYRLGPQLFELGERVPRLRSVRNRIRPFLRELRERTDCTVVLGVLDRDEVLYLLEAALMPSTSSSRLPAARRHPPCATGSAYRCTAPRSGRSCSPTAGVRRLTGSRRPGCPATPARLSSAPACCVANWAGSVAKATAPSMRSSGMDTPASRLR